MSVYRDTTGTVTFNHPIGTALTATVVNRTGQTWVTPEPIEPVANTYTLTIPWELTQYDSTLVITWTDGVDFIRNQTTQVVSPILSTSQLTDCFVRDGQTPPPAEELAELEATARAVIQTYCGQSFGYYAGPRQYVGNGSGKIILDQRCEVLTGVLGGLSFRLPTLLDPLGAVNLDRVSLIEDNWSVVIEWPEYLSIKESPPIELINYAPSEDGVIRVPRRYYAGRDRGAKYVLNGIWGYTEVPREVQEAAMLLINDYATGDSGYRDRYLSILKIQQDSFTYHPGAFRGTGNARADLLLGPYRRQPGMIVF